MAKTEKLLRLNLQLFGEGGASGGDGSASGEGVSAQSPSVQQGVSATDPVSQQGVEAHDPDVQTTTTAENKAPEVTREQRKAEFERRIKNEDKEFYDERINRAVRDRMKNTEGKAKNYDLIESQLPYLMKKYGVSDLNSLVTAIEDEDLENRSLAEGMTKEQLRHLDKVERENEKFRKADEERVAAEQKAQREAAINAQVAKWNSDAEAVKAVYSDFDLKREMENDTFKQLLRSNIPMQTAYEVVHHKELVTGAMRSANKAAEEKIAKSVAANSRRVSENGVSSNAAAVVGVDVSKMTREQREALNARAARGEKIVLGTNG